MKVISSSVVKLIFDTDFENVDKNGISIYEPVCQLINSCLSTKSSWADAANLWLHLKLPDRYNEAVEKRKKNSVEQICASRILFAPQIQK